MERRKVRYPEVSKLTGIEVPTLYAMVSRHQIPHYRLSRRLVVFDVDEIEAWMKQRHNDAVGGSR